jgi:CTP:molybdopterin cytidylyltransferase MocA
VIAARIVAALGDIVVLVVADASRTAESVVADLRAAQSDERDSVLLLIAGDVPTLDRALLRAAIGPLALELAPAQRLNALDVGGEAIDADVIEAARFLSAAESTTGQLLEIR